MIINRYLISLIFTIILLSCSTNNNNLTGGDETGNPIVVGKIIDNNGNDASGVIVSITTKDYIFGSNNGRLYKDTTNNSGIFSFSGMTKGEYNCKAIDYKNSLISFDENFVISNKNIFVNDTLYYYDTLTGHSYLEILLPEEVDTSQKYLYIKGTDYSFDLTDAVKLNSGEWELTVDELPIDVSLNLYLGDVNTDIISIFLDSFLIEEVGDTAQIGLFGIERVVNTSNSDLPVNTIVTFVKAKNNIFWVGTYLGGLISWDLDTDSITVYDKQNSILKDNYISTIAIDSMDRIFVGTHNGGLLVIDDDSWELFNNTNSSQIGNAITALEILPNNKCLVGTPNGLLRFDFDKKEIYNYDTIMNLFDIVTSISAVSDSNIWVGTATSGLVNVHNDTTDYYTIFDSDIPDNQINCIKQDNVGNIWVGTIYGVTKISLTGELNITTEIVNYYGDLDVYSISIDSKGNVWFGLLGDPSFLRYDGKEYRQYYMDYLNLDKNPGNINAIIDYNKKLYVASAYSGIILLENHIN